MFIKRNYPDSYLTEIGQPSTNGFLVRKGNASAGAPFFTRLLETSSYTTTAFCHGTYELVFPARNGLSVRLPYTYEDDNGNEHRGSVSHAVRCEEARVAFNIPRDDYCRDKAEIFNWSRTARGKDWLIDGGDYDGHAVFRPNGCSHNYFATPYWGTDPYGSSPTMHSGPPANPKEGYWTLAVCGSIASIPRGLYPDKDGLRRPSGYVCAWWYSSKAQHYPDGLEFKYSSVEVVWSSSYTAGDLMLTGVKELYEDLYKNYTITVEFRPYENP